MAEAPDPPPPVICIVGNVTYPAPELAILILVITLAVLSTERTVAGVVYPPPTKFTVGVEVYPLPPLLIVIPVIPLTDVLIFKEVPPAPVTVEDWEATNVDVKSVSYPIPYLTNSAETIPPTESIDLTFNTDPEPKPFVILKSCPALKFLPACRIETFDVVATILASKIPP